MKRGLAALALTLCLLCGCGAPAGPVQEPAAAEPVPEQKTDPILEQLQAMRLEEQVGQLFLVEPGAAGAGVEKIPVGGYCLFARQIQDPEQLAALLAELTAETEIPPIFAVDEEGGTVSRLAGNPAFALPKTPPMSEIAATGEPNNAAAAAETIGGYLRTYGFTLEFAPVADVNTNPDNPVIGSRAFGSDPEQAAEMVAAAVTGFHRAGIGCTLKHFPGHGDTAADTHTGSVTADKTWAELESCELLPFRAGIEGGADAVMVAHILTPNATSDGLPASLSREIITEKLRGELGFDGLIVTDAMNMAAISANYSAGEAAVMAVAAGADLVLMPENLPEAYNAVLAAVEDGTISRQRLEESVYRILAFKAAQ